MKTAAIVAISLTLALILGTLAGIAFNEPHRAGAAKTCFTHDQALTDALDTWAAVSGVRDCGIGGDIRLRIVPSAHFLGSGTIAGAEDYHAYCDVVVSAEYATDRAVLAHEVGHCLGLEHNAAGIMHDPASTTTASVADRAAIQALYGPLPMRVRVGIAVGN